MEGVGFQADYKGGFTRRPQDNASKEREPPDVIGQYVEQRVAAVGKAVRGRNSVTRAGVCKEASQL